MITREIQEELLQSSREYPIVTILGPRQSGKTTLVKMTFPEKPYLSLEAPDLRQAASLDPRAFLGGLKEGAILDEVQRLPVLLSYLQGMVDEDARPGRFILTGSHQPRLHEAISQSLAGRSAILTLWPFSCRELRNYKTAFDPFEMMTKGFYPRLHEKRLKTRRFFNSYLQTYIERDVRALVQLRNLSQFQQFLTLLAGRVGQLINHASLSNDLGVSTTTIRNWMNVLKASYVLMELPPYSGNIRKRLVKSSKIYFTDVGLAAFLLGIHKKEQAARDPLRGHLYENLVIADIIKGALNRGLRPEVYFYRDSHGNEVDLVIREQGLLIPVEIKSAATFSADFIKGIENFRATAQNPVAGGAVLFNGSQTLELRGIRIFNPLSAENLWSSLTTQSQG